MARSYLVSSIFCRQLLVSWPCLVLAFGVFHSICSNHMVVGALELTLSSGIHPMCLQRVHCYVSVVVWVEFE